MATALYGRLEAYQIAGDKMMDDTQGDSGAAFKAALCRNIYRSEDPKDLPLEALQQYTVQQKKFLSTLTVETFLEGDITFCPHGENL